MKLDRRQFVKSAAGLTALSLGLNLYSPSIFKRRILAAPGAPGRKKLIFIFQRGGNDAINTVIPRGDPQYNTTLRPNLYIQPGEGLSLDGTNPQYPIDAPLRNSFVQLHPSLAPLMEVYQAGDLAILHRIGYKNQSQSHFDSQQYYENGTTNPNLDEGMLYRQTAEMLMASNPFPALSVSSSRVVALQGPSPIPNITDVKTFKFAGSASKNSKFLGRSPGPGVSGRGVLGVYGGPADDPNKPYRDIVYRTGLVLADAMARAATINPDTYVPQNGATYPNGNSFYYKSKQIAQLMKETPVQIIGMNIGGWDTHTNQGRVNGGHPSLLNQVALMIQSLSRDLRDQWQDVVLVTMTEFGRTSYQNGSAGTDHASAISMFVAGGSVKGGVYNARDTQSWTLDGGILSTSNGRYLRYHTDFRAVFAEIFLRHFGDDNFGQTAGLPILNRVIPGYNSLATANPNEYRFLNFL